MLDTTRAATLIDNIKRAAEAARAHLSWWTVDCAGMRDEADRIANALYMVAAGIECDVREAISKDLVDSQAIRAVALEVRSCDDDILARPLDKRLHLDDVACFAVSVAGAVPADRAAELGRVADSIDHCASSARFILTADTGQRRRPTELVTIARLIRHLAATVHPHSREG